MGSFVEGVLIGLSLAILTGPLLLAIIHVSINYGVRRGLILTSGIWFSDLLYILGFYYLSEELGRVIQSPSVMMWIGIISAMLVISIGVFIWLKPNGEKTATPALLSKKPFWLSGFMLNTFNAFTVAFWSGIMFNYAVNTGTGSLHNVTFLLAGIFLTIIVTDTVKVLASHRLKAILNITATSFFNKMAAILFIIIGLLMLLKTLAVF